MSKEAEKPPFADVLTQRLHEIDEASERWRREHPDEDDESGGKSQPSAQPREGAAAEREAKLAQWEGEMRDYAETHGGVMPPKPSFASYQKQPVVRLIDQPAPPTPSEAVAASAPSDTETLLNGLIEECRFLLREVAFHSARLTSDADDRIRFLTAAQNLAITGANVGKVIARLRGDHAPGVQERRHYMVYEHVQTVASPPPPGGGPP